MKMYFIEGQNKTVKVTSNRSLMPKYSPFPLRARSFVSNVFQLCMIEAYKNEGWNIDIDSDCESVWENRPAEFNDRHKTKTGL